MHHIYIWTDSCTLSSVSPRVILAITLPEHEIVGLTVAGRMNPSIPRRDYNREDGYQRLYKDLKPLCTAQNR
jgi:hypothetical protein